MENECAPRRWREVVGNSFKKGDEAGTRGIIEG